MNAQRYFCIGMFACIPGPLLVFAYNILVRQLFGYSPTIDAQTLAITSGLFSFGMLLCLALIIATLLSNTERNAFQAYRRKGYLSVLMFLYFLSLGNLSLTALLSVLALSGVLTDWGLLMLKMTFLNSPIQLIAVTIPALNLSKFSTTRGSHGY